MLDGQLPEAPIMHDIRELKSTDVEDIDALVAGFPCQGFSTVGVGRGWGDDRSNLFKEILHISDIAKPKVIFLENVPVIMNSMDRIANELHVCRGYELRWICMPASDVGAPHLRLRWFCLGINPDYVHDICEWTWTDLNYEPFDWSSEPTARMIPHMTANDRVRMQKLGNSVVPDAVRRAFIILASGFRTTDICASTIAFSDSCVSITPLDFKGVFPRCAILKDHQVHEHRYCFRRPTLKLVITGHDSVPDRLHPLTRNKLVTTEIGRAGWATPRQSCIYPSHVLTKRTIQDLGTMLAFESNTPKHHREWKVNPAFVEWLMGFSEGYTLS